MATKGIEPDEAWQKITDGTETATVQVKRGIIGLCDSTTQPDRDAEYQDYAGNIMISPPTVAWIKNITPGLKGSHSLGYAKIVIIK